MMECYFAISHPERGDLIVGPLSLPELEHAVRRAGWAILRGLRSERDEQPRRQVARA